MKIIPALNMPDVSDTVLLCSKLRRHSLSEALKGKRSFPYGNKQNQRG